MQETNDDVKIKYEWRHPCNTCGKQWCKCHQDIRYKYPSYVPDNYDPKEELKCIKK